MTSGRLVLTSGNATTLSINRSTAVDNNTNDNDEEVVRRIRPVFVSVAACPGAPAPPGTGGVEDVPRMNLKLAVQTYGTYQREQTMKTKTRFCNFRGLLLFVLMMLVGQPVFADGARDICFKLNSYCGAALRTQNFLGMKLSPEMRTERERQYEADYEACKVQERRAAQIGYDAQRCGMLMYGQSRSYPLNPPRGSTAGGSGGGNGGSSGSPTQWVDTRAGGTARGGGSTGRGGGSASGKHGCIPADVACSGGDAKCLAELAEMRRRCGR